MQVAHAGDSKIPRRSYENIRSFFFYLSRGFFSIPGKQGYFLKSRSKSQKIFYQVKLGAYLQVLKSHSFYSLCLPEKE